MYSLPLIYEFGSYTKEDLYTYSVSSFCRSALEKVIQLSDHDQR